MGIKKHIILITPGFASNEQDSAAVPYLQDYCRHLANTIGPAHITIVATQYPFTRTPYTWHNIQVIPIGGANKKGFNTIRTFFRTQKVLRRITREKDCILHAFWLSDAAMSAGRFARKYKLPCIVTLMGQDVKPGNHYFSLMPKETRWFALSDTQKSIFENNYDAEVTEVIPFPLPDIAPRVGLLRSIDVLFVGSYIDVKQPLQFIDILADIKKQHAGVRAVMIGGGPLQAEIERAAAAKGLSQNLIIHGMMQREHVLETMQHAQILIHTSAFEGQCMVYGEALLSGMHVLSYPVGRIVSTPKHIICNEPSEFVLNTMQLLSHPVNFAPVQTVSAKESIAAYLWHYGWHQES